MAKPVSEEELQLKKRARRRLIGAIALVAAVAAVLPMVLDSEPKPGPQDISIQIPPPEPKGAGLPKKAPAAPVAPRSDKDASATGARAPELVNPDKADASARARQSTDKPEARTAEGSAADAKPAAATAAARPESNTAATGASGNTGVTAARLPDNPNDVALSRVPKAASEKAAAKTQDKAAEKVSEKAPVKAPEKVADKPADKRDEKSAATAAAPKAGPGAYFIQVIALSEAQKAKQVQQQITGAGVRAYTEVVNAGPGAVTRVRAGPFATREEADKAQARLQGIGLDGKVAAY